jgi:ammonium transporter, Amt family
MKKILAITMLAVMMSMMFSGLLFAGDIPAPTPDGAPAAEAPAVPNKVDTGDTAWMIVATALVMIMTLPGLALFYGGMAKSKNSLNTLAMSFVAYAIASVLWVLYGYSLVFSADIGGIIGAPDKFFLSGVGVNSITDLAKTIPEYVFIVYQLTFAAITVALASGSYVGRMKFSAWILFSVLWLTITYVPIAHWVWGNGFLQQLGALDFAGGTVVHINAGVAGLVGALMLGKRKDPSYKPNNLPFVVIGAGLLWFGWFGFNAGSALGANGLAGAAFLNTNTATAMAAMAWMFTEWMHAGKPTILGLASGAVAGLVTITPAAGFVNLSGALVIGLVAGIIPYFAVAKLKPLLGYDDALDAFGVHAVGGILGALLTGVLADPLINEAGTGLLYGNPGQLAIQALAVGVTIAYTAITTFIIFVIIKAVTGIRVDAEEEYSGLDETQHGEKSYNL